MVNTEILKIIVKNERYLKKALNKIFKIFKSISLDNLNNIRIIIDDVYKEIKEELYQSFIYVYNDINLRVHYAIQMNYKADYPIKNITKNMIVQKIDKPFLGSTIDKRLEKHKMKLIKTIYQFDYNNKTKVESKKHILHRIKVAQSELKRVVATEGNRLMNDSVSEAINDATYIERKIFVATLDNRTSEICRSMDGKVFYKDELIKGVNDPPLHFYCRSVLAVYDDDEIQSRIERDVITGKSKYLDKYMTFEEWKNKNNL